VSVRWPSLFLQCYRLWHWPLPLRPYRSSPNSSYRCRIPGSTAPQHYCPSGLLRHRGTLSGIFPGGWSIGSLPRSCSSAALLVDFLLSTRNRPPPMGGRSAGGGPCALLPGDPLTAFPPDRWPVSLSAPDTHGCLSVSLLAGL